MSPGTRGACSATTLAVMIAAVPGPATGQERTVVEADLPEAAAEAVVAFLNAPGTVRFDAPARVPAGSVIEGDVGVLGGPLTLDGTIRGRVVVVNGDVDFGDDGRVEGDVVVVGGEARQRTSASVGGTLTIYEEGLAYAEREGRITLRRRPGIGQERGAGIFWGRARFMVRTWGTYNRVEGLPVLFGPVLEGGSADPWRAEVMALWRSESGLTLDEDEMGYLIRGEKRVGARPTWVLGGSYHSLVTPLGPVGLSDLESSLATFFFHKDFRDYVDARGWSLSLGLDLDPWPLSLRLTYADEEHRFAPVSSPWTLRRNDDPWRPQPLVAEGDVRTLAGELEVDRRNDPEHPSHGWHLTGRLLRGVGGELAVPEAERPVEPEPVPVPARPVDAGFTSASVDLRRYNRVSPTSELNLRLVWAGSVDGDPLPPQYQTALGGEGTLPGYSLFDLDCGARGDLLNIRRVAFDDDQDTTHPVFPSYGCDRAFLAQLEYRSHLSLNLDLGPDDDEDWTADAGWYPVVDLDPTVVVFADLGRGWSRSDPALDSGTFADVGLGVYLGDLGFYWAWPLNGDDRGVNFFIRLQRRF